MFISEEYSTVLRGDVSVSRFVVVSCSICFFFAMVVCEVIIWESAEKGVFGCSIFITSVCECEFVFVCCKVMIDL